MWPRPKPRAGIFFPNGFRPQRIALSSARAVAELPPATIAAFFRYHPEAAQALYLEALSKHHTPSTFLSRQPTRWVVGWYAPPSATECQQHFDHLPDAATDYLLFSLGKGRWRPTDTLP